MHEKCAYCGKTIEYRTFDGTYRDERGQEECQAYESGYPRLHEPVTRVRGGWPLTK